MSTERELFKYYPFKEF